MTLHQIQAADRALLEAISAALAESARLSGDWIACRPGCTPCCFGPFPITPLDAIRLRAGLAVLETGDRSKAARIARRTRDYLDRIEVLDDDGLPERMDDVPCPALDPATGLCDVYEHRPITCRTFGPAARAGNSIGACELCYVGATEEQIAACAVVFDAGRESAILERLGEPAHGSTVAHALAASRR
jgi:Fe-S-cluster containining protein